MIQNVHIIKKYKDKQFVLVRLQHFLVDLYKIEKDLHVIVMVYPSLKSICSLWLLKQYIGVYASHLLLTRCIFWIVILAVQVCDKRRLIVIYSIIVAIIVFLASIISFVMLWRLLQQANPLHHDAQGSHSFKVDFILLIVLGELYLEWNFLSYFLTFIGTKTSGPLVGSISASTLKFLKSQYEISISLGKKLCVNALLDKFHWLTSEIQ